MAFVFYGGKQIEGVAFPGDEPSLALIEPAAMVQGKIDKSAEVGEIK